MAEAQRYVLIVEDDLELCELLAQAVRDLSDTYDVKTAKNVDEAMAHVRRFQTRAKAFDLVITDVKMSGLSGLELLQVLNNISPEAKTVVMTAYNSADLAERAQELDVYAYLTKPFIISEFRRIVQAAIAPPKTEPDTAAVALSAAQQRAVRKQLSSLRMMTGANIALLIHHSGVTLASDAIESDLEVIGLSQALMTAQQHVGQQMAQDLNAETEIKQSYFGADTYNVCTYRIDKSLFVSVIFGPAVKEGQVWYYLRDAVEGLALALEAREGEAVDEGMSVKDELMAMLDQYLPTEPRRRRGRRPGTPARAKAQTAATTPKPAKKPSPSKTPAPAKAQPEPPVLETEPDVSIDDLDWDVDTELDWDALVAETDQGFGGLSLEAAQKQGVVAPEIVPSPPDQAPPTGETATAEQVEIDDIDWDLDAAMDWDELVAETDQGFGGLSMEQARKNGIIDELD